MVKQSIKFIVAGILATLFVTGATTGHAQNYPVQAFATLTPPYSLKLSDYAAPEGNRMRITLLLKDAQQPTLDVRLKLTIEGNGVKLTTNPSFHPTPITLLSSTLYEVSYDELSDYFLPQNLIADGISMGALTSSGMLPEGLYRFKVEAMEAHRDVPVSNTAMAIGWLMLNDPPQWISPRQGQKLTAGEPQGIQFLWTRCGMSSPNAALSTQYEVTMVEMVQQGMDPNVAIVTLPPIYQEVSPIENLFYGPDKPELIPGHSYAVRIRAFDTRGIDLYRNGGYSPVVTFRYGDPCIAPVFLSSDNISEQTADLSWNSTALATGYRVRFRENGTDLSDWYEEPATQTSYTVKNLKPDCTYEYQVQSECGSLPSDYSVSGTLRTKKLENQNQTCSEQLDNANMPTNRDPLPALHTNQTFLAGVMPVKVTSVQGSNGIFTGTGVVYLPIAGVGLSCTFNRVGINTTYQLISGEVITTRSKNTAIYGSGGVTVLDTLHLDNPIDTIIVNPNGDVAVVSGGDTTFIPLANQPVVIYPPTEGGDGTTTGNNTGNGGGDGAGGGGSTGGGGTTSYGDGPLIVENGTVKPYNPAGDLPTALFHKASMSTYGYDSLAYEALRSYYPVATINGKEVGIPYKALPVSGSDNVVLELKPGSSKLTTDSLTIDVQTNAKVMSRSVMGNNRLMVSLQGLSEGEEPIMVRYTKHDVDGKTEQVDIGAAKAVVYQPQPMKLVVVPLAGTTAPDASALQSQLSAIYGQAVTSWTVTVTAPFAYTIPGGQLEFGSSEMASSYTEGMNNLIDAYKVANPSLEDGTYYLFVVPRFSDATLQGYMPRARRFGFIAQSSTDARTLAHELGHGAFNLEHTFPVLPQGTTDNLMDYNGGTRLIKPQWDLIHNPELTTGLLDDETDAASKKEFIIDYSDYNISGSQAISDYIFNKKRDEFISQLNMYGYYKLSKDKRVDVSKHIIKDLLGNVIIYDPYESYMITEALGQSIVYETIFNNYIKFKGLTEENQVYDRIRETIEDDLGNVFAFYSDLKSITDYILIINKSMPTVEEFSKQIPYRINMEGVRKLLLSLSSSQLKKWIDLKCPNMSNATRQKIFSCKKIGNYSNKLDELASSLNTDNIASIVEKTDDGTLSLLNNSNYLKPEFKLEAVSKAEIASSLLGCAVLMRKAYNGEKISPLDLLTFMPNGIWALGMVFDDYINKLSKNISGDFFENLEWINFVDWDNRFKGKNGFPNEPLYFYYTDENIRVKPNLTPTSILILDKEVAKDIFEYEPVYLDYNDGSSIKYIDKAIYFKPINQVRIQW